MRTLLSLSRALLQGRYLLPGLAAVVCSTSFKTPAQVVVNRERPAILFRTDGSEINWLVLDVPIEDEELFFRGAVLRLATPAGTVTDTLHDAAFVTHAPQHTRPSFSQQLYFLRNRHPTTIEAALLQGRGITVELRQPGTALVRQYHQTDRTLLVNTRPVLLNRGLSISSTTVQAGSKP